MSRVCAICNRPEVDGEVISGQNVATIEGYVVVNFEVASSSSFRDISKTFRDDGGEGGGGLLTIALCETLTLIPSLFLVHARALTSLPELVIEDKYS